MNALDILKQLEPLSSESYKRVLLNHGAREPVMGVKIGELKRIQKRVKKNHALSLALFDTGIYDAQYLAGLIADEIEITKKNLQHWLAASNCRTLRGTTVAWVAAESRHGRELALRWIMSKKQDAAHAGWATFASLVSIRDDSQLDLSELAELLERVERTIHDQPDDVRYTMNEFVISLGIYVRPLTENAMQAGEKIGRVSVDMGPTACKVPYAPDYIRKAEARGVLGRKRKTARC